MRKQQASRKRQQQQQRQRGSRRQQAWPRQKQRHGSSGSSASSTSAQIAAGAKMLAMLENMHTQLTRAEFAAGPRVNFDTGAAIGPAVDVHAITQALASTAPARARGPSASLISPGPQLAGQPSLVQNLRDGSRAWEAPAIMMRVRLCPVMHAYSGPWHLTLASAACSHRTCTCHSPCWKNCNRFKVRCLAAS